MCERTVVLLAALATCALGAGKAKPVTVNGQAIIPGKAIVALEPVEISQIKLFECTMADTGPPCTVFSGFIKTNYACGESIVTLHVDLWMVRQNPNPILGDTLVKRESIEVAIERPAFGKSVKFTTIAGPIIPHETRDEHMRNGWRPAYTLRATVAPYLGAGIKP